MDNVILFFVNNSKYHIYDIKNIKKIHSGYSNNNYLFILFNKKKYHIRISKNINKYRKNEKHALKLMNNKDFIYFDSKTGNSIKEWIEGKVIKRWNKNILIKLILKIKKLHKIKPKGLLKHNYKKHLPNNIDKKYLNHYLFLIKKYKNDSCVFSHNDINSKNIIQNKNEVFLIDFEYARANSKYWDIANLIKESNFNKKQKQIILNIYSNLNEKKLDDYIFINIFYSYAWALDHPDQKLVYKYKKKMKRKLLKYNI